MQTTHRSQKECKKKITSFIKWNDGIESGRTVASKVDGRQHQKRTTKGILKSVDCIAHLVW